MTSNSIKAVITFYVCAFAFKYGINFFLSFSKLSLLERLLWEVMACPILFLLVVLTAKLFIGKWDLKMVGWRKGNFSGSFLWVSALLLPTTIGNLLAAHVVGISAVMKGGNIGLNSPYPFWLFLFGLVFWSLSGVISFPLWQAFPYECLRDYSKKYVLPAIALPFILSYNAPLLTGAFKLGDILWLGIVFPLLYHKFRNSLSLTLAYVILFESPVLWCFGAVLGATVFLIGLYARVS